MDADINDGDVQELAEQLIDLQNEQIKDLKWSIRQMVNRFAIKTQIKNVFSKWSEV